MGKLVIKNLYGGDIEIESACRICGKTHTYRLKERQICNDDKCFEESKRRHERNNANFNKR